MLHMYGIKNCDTVKKARQYLDHKNIAYEFHDFKKELPTKKQLDAWLKHLDWKVLLNMRSMTWRKLPDSERHEINKAKAIKLMLEKPSIIKRPVVEKDNEIFIGFDVTIYNAIITH